MVKTNQEDEDREGKQGPAEACKGLYQVGYKDYKNQIKDGH